jgi:hypothetical protein
LFVHAVLEGFAAVDEDYGHFVGELAAELFVGVDVDFLPAEQTAAFELDQASLTISQRGTPCGYRRGPGERQSFAEFSIFGANFNWPAFKEVYTSGGAVVSFR